MLPSVDLLGSITDAQLRLCPEFQETPTEWARWRRPSTARQGLPTLWPTLPL